jgi:hypothetical protein
MYVARFTNNPQADIERGWSGYFATNWNTIEEAINDTNAELLEDELLEETQQRWINTWGDKYEEYDTFITEYMEEIAEELNIVFDEQSKIYRPFHHWGLSCWALEANTEEEAIQEISERTDIQWGGFGQQTIGDVKIIKQINDLLWLFECEDAQNEM